jgi:hypothetical protein
LVPCATLSIVTTNPHRSEIADYLHRASCHFGQTFREELYGLSVDEASDNRDVGRDQVASCRRAVHRVIAGEFSADETQASYDEAVYRAAALPRGDVIWAALVRARAAGAVQGRVVPDLKVEPLQCPYAAGAPAKAGVGKVREPQVCPDCHMAHAGDCW